MTVKDKVVPVHTIRAYRGNRGRAPPLLISVLNMVSGITTRAGFFTYVERTQVIKWRGGCVSTTAGLIVLQLVPAKK
jgi:hypothetical protein